MISLGCGWDKNFAGITYSDGFKVIDTVTKGTESQCWSDPVGCFRISIDLEMKLTLYALRGTRTDKP